MAKKILKTKSTATKSKVKVKKTNAREAVGRIPRVEKKDIKYVVIVTPRGGFLSFTEMKFVEYFSDLKDVIRYMKGVTTEEVKIFEVAGEIKTRSKIELAI